MGLKRYVPPSYRKPYDHTDRFIVLVLIACFAFLASSYFGRIENPASMEPRIAQASE